LSAGETKTVTHTFDEESSYENLRGKEAVFTIEVQGVKAVQLPELDDEFAQTLGDFNNMVGLREAIRQQLEQNQNQQYDQDYYDGLINEIIDQASVKYPPHMLDEEVEQFLHNLEHNLERDRLDLTTYLKMRELERDAFIESEVKPAAERRLLRSLVLEEFARQESLEVKNEELQYIYYSAQQQVSEFQKSQAGKRQNAREMANNLAMNTINNIFNQRIMQRLKAIATGRGDEPEEEPDVLDALTGAEFETALAEEAEEVELQAQESDAEASLMEATEPLAVSESGEASAAIGADAAEEEEEAALADLDVEVAAPAEAETDDENPDAGEIAA
jgi:trigger factor